MKRLVLTLALVCAAALPALAAGTSTPDWKMNASIIEACSCPMFCSCYFGSGHPAGHHNMENMAEEHFCRFNNAIRVNKGNYGKTKLDGAKFWVAGDLGGDFAKGGEWAVVTFDRKLTKEQRDGIIAIVPKLYNLAFKSITTAEADMEWTTGKGTAHASLDGGKVAEVSLQNGSFAGNGGKATPVIKDLQYWGSTHNDGFVLMPNVVEAYRTGDKAFEFKGTNGFMITFDIDSKSTETKTASAGN